MASEDKLRCPECMELKESAAPGAKRAEGRTMKEQLAKVTRDRERKAKR